MDDEEEEATANIVLLLTILLMTNWLQQFLQCVWKTEVRTT